MIENIAIYKYTRFTLKPSSEKRCRNIESSQERQQSLFSIQKLFNSKGKQWHYIALRQGKMFQKTSRKLKKKIFKKEIEKFHLPVCKTNFRLKIKENSKYVGDLFHGYSEG